MTTATHTPSTIATAASARAESLARRLEEGVEALAAYATTLSDAQWRTPIPRDGREVGVVVHHVASVFPIEIELAQILAASQPITGVTWDGIHEMNANHAKVNAGITKQAAIELLRENAASAAAAIRAFSDTDLAGAAPVSLYADAPLTCQFILEDHAVRHCYHHLAKIRGALQP